DDIEQAEAESEDDAEAQADDGESDRQQHAHDHGNQKLAAKEGDDDGDKFPREGHHVFARLGVQEGKGAVTALGRVALRLEEKEEVNGNDGESRGQTKNTQYHSARREKTGGGCQEPIAQSGERRFQMFLQRAMLFLLIPENIRPKRKVFLEVGDALAHKLR